MRYRRLFTPITINGMELKNRIVMPAMHLSLIHISEPTRH